MQATRKSAGYTYVFFFQTKKLAMSVKIEVLSKDLESLAQALVTEQ
jgi:hypothetical protein